MTELLSPAGNAECLRAAIAGGADAIYLGGSRYGARAFADNFSDDELLSAIRYAHLYHKKIYLTVNILTREQELSGLPVFLRPLYEEGLDGVIAADIGVISVIRDHFGDLPVHASTQMTLTGPLGPKMLKDLGVSRIVPARELSLKELEYLRNNTDMELEVFIHGAMCYAYSGQCLASSLLGQRSGNRGRCAGACRLPYRIVKSGEKPESDREYYPLSLKDLCGLPVLRKLMDMGIDSFKIEGRMKSPDYVFMITSMYRRYMDDPQKPVSSEDIMLLEQRFNRGGLKTGYFSQHNGKDMVLLTRSGYIGSSVNVSQSADTAPKNDVPCPEPIRVKAELYWEEDKELVYTLSVSGYDKHFEGTGRGGYFEEARKRPMSYEEIERQLTKLGNTSFEAESFSILKRGIRNEEPKLITQDDLPPVFCQVKTLNELRRRAVSELINNMLRTRLRKAGPVNGSPDERAKIGNVHFPVADSINEGDHETKGSGERPYAVSVRNLEQLRAVENADLSRVSSVMIAYDLYRTPGLKNAAIDILSGMKDHGISPYLRLPQVTRIRMTGEYDSVISDDTVSFFDGFVTGNLETAAYLKKRFKDEDCRKKLVTDAGLYSFQSETVFQFGRWGIFAHVLPYELTAFQMGELLELVKAKTGGHRFFLPVYGYIPAMISAQCLRATDGSCLMEKSTAFAARARAASDRVYLCDRKGKYLPALFHCDRCENTIYNTVPLSLHRDMDRVSGIDAARLLSFTIESGEDTLEITRFFVNDVKGAVPRGLREFTRGHFVRGVD